jgi:hypothetical protein
MIYMKNRHQYCNYMAELELQARLNVCPNTDAFPSSRPSAQ